MGGLNSGTAGSDRVAPGDREPPDGHRRAGRDDAVGGVAGGGAGGGLEVGGLAPGAGRGAGALFACVMDLSASRGYRAARAATGSA